MRRYYWGSALIDLAIARNLTISAVYFFEASARLIGGGTIELFDTSVVLIVVSPSV